MIGLQAGGLLGRHDGVVEKTPGVRYLRRIRQLALADGDDGLGHILRAGHRDLALGQFLRHIGVAEIGLPRLGQAKDNTGDGNTAIEMPA